MPAAGRGRRAGGGWSGVGYRLGGRMVSESRHPELDIPPSSERYAADAAESSAFHARNGSRRAQPAT